jgi:hypothetical protein
LPPLAIIFAYFIDAAAGFAAALSLCHYLAFFFEIRHAISLFAITRCRYADFLRFAFASLLLFADAAMLPIRCHAAPLLLPLADFRRCRFYYAIIDADFR